MRPSDTEDAVINTTEKQISGLGVGWRVCSRLEKGCNAWEVVNCLFYCGKGHFITGLIHFTARQNSGPDSSGFAYGFMESFVMDGLADTATKLLPAPLRLSLHPQLSLPPH